MLKKIVFIGGTGGCLDLIDLAFEVNNHQKMYDLVGVLDDSYKNMPSLICDIPLLGGTNLLPELLEESSLTFITAIGNQNNFRNRAKILNSFNIPDDRWETLVHPTANISRSTKIGFGTAIHAGVSIGPNCTLGHNCLILPNVVIGHDSIILDNVMVNAGVAIAGHVRIEESCYIGIGATIRDHVSIERSTLIGMGSVVVSNCSSNSKYIGNPARVIYE